MRYSSIILLLFSIFTLASMQPAMAQEQLLRTVTVTGEGRQRIPTTLTQVNLGVEIQGQTATEVQQEVAKRTAAVVELLRSRKVEQLQTTGLSLQPNYDYSDRQRRLLGYVGTNTVRFRFQTEQVGALLDEAVKTGATRIDSLSFTATEEAIAQAQKQALALATKDAQQQAEAVLKALNLNAKEVVSIQINGANVPVPRMVQSEQLARSAADATTPVVGGEQTVRAAVTLQISY